MVCLQSSFTFSNNFFMTIICNTFAKCQKSLKSGDVVIKRPYYQEYCNHSDHGSFETWKIKMNISFKISLRRNQNYHNVSTIQVSGQLLSRKPLKPIQTGKSQNGKILNHNYRIFKMFSNISWFVISPALKKFKPFLHDYYV